MSRRRTLSGRFRPKHKKKYGGDHTKIVYRSSWELKFMRYCDDHSSILTWQSEEIAISYFDPVKNKMRRYFPDFLIKVKDKEGIIKNILIEIKPKRQTKPPKNKNLKESMTYETNAAKWRAALIWCEKRKIEFKIMTEIELQIKV